MAKTARQVVMAMGLVAIGLVGTTPSLVCAEPEFPALRILVTTVTGVPRPDMLARAQTESARIYAAIGVRLIWESRDAPTKAIDSTDALSLPSRLTMLIIANPNAWSERVAANALGAAPAADNGVGRLAYAFHERIESSARLHGTDPAKILGYVMAHEFGHLLLARGAHSSTGIMSSRWNRFKIHSVETSSLRFTKVQAEWIRSTVIEMNAGRPSMSRKDKDP